MTRSGLSVPRFSASVTRLSRGVAFLSMVAFGACDGGPGYEGRSTNEWIHSLEGGDAEQRERAATALGGILRIEPRSPRVVDALIAALNDSLDAVRMSAAASLVSEGVRAPGAVPGLHRALHDSSHDNVRALAARVIGELRPDPSEASVAVLVEALSDPSARVRAAAAGALGDFGVAGRSAAPVLSRLVLDADGNVRSRAMDALAAVRVSSESAVVVFARALRGGTAGSRASAAYHLGQLRTAARPALSALLQASRDSAPLVRAAVASALVEAGGGRPDVERRLKQLALDPDSMVSRRVEVMHRRGPVP